MSLSVQHVINEARNLVLKLKEQDLKTDKLISSAQVLNNSVDAMKEVKMIFSNLTYILTDILTDILIIILNSTMNTCVF